MDEDEVSVEYLQIGRTREKQQKGKVDNPPFRTEENIVKIAFSATNVLVWYSRSREVFFPLCWPSRWKSGNRRACWHICCEQVLLLGGNELLSQLRSQESLRLRSGFIGDDQLEAGNWTFFCLATLTHLECLSNLCSLQYEHPRYCGH